MAYPHLAARLFNTPLMAHPDKAQAIALAVGPRLLGVEGDPTPQASGPGDSRDTKDYYVTEDGIAVVPVLGSLVSRGRMNFLSGGPTTYQEIEEQVMDAATDPSIKGILLDIDSPGGEAGGTFDLARTIREAATLKPTYASANHEAYSAAYALAAAAERLYVTETGGVGSVGVIAVHAEASQANKAAGINVTVFRAGARKAEHNSLEPLTEAAADSLQTELDRLHTLFAEQVAAHRGLSVETVRATEAATLHGPAAVAAGFADHIGTLADALTALRHRIETTPTERPTAAHNTEAHTMKTEAPQAAPPASEKEIDLSAYRAEGYNEALEQVKEINQLCALAGCPEKAIAFIDQGLSVAKVREALVKAQAEADKVEVDTHHEGLAPSMADQHTILSTAHQDVYARLRNQRQIA